MFPQNGEKVPEIRFAGFSDDWEQRKLEDVVEFLDTMRKPLEGAKRISGPYPYYGASGIVDYVDGYLFDEELILLSEDGANITDRNYPVCFIASGKYWVNNHAHVLRTKKENENNFICNSLERKDYTQYNTGMAMPKLNKETCRKIPVLCPVFKEQQKIGDYFRSLDNLITLHQRKCEQTKKLKKYMLQKMFPQNGAKVPEIRFDGFTYDWEQRKLSDVLDIVTKRNGEKYGKEEVLSVSDEYGCINQIKFQGRSFAGEDISNYKIVDTGDIIYTRSPLKSKPYGIIKVVGDEIGIVSPLYIVNKVKEGNNSQFIYRVFDSPEKTNKYLSPLVRKGAKNTMNISNDEWLSGKIDVAPSYEEQYQIGLYFDHLDHFITLHQRQHKLHLNALL